jgi:hypothetical protein
MSGENETMKNDADPYQEALTGQYSYAYPVAEWEPGEEPVTVHPFKMADEQLCEAIRICAKLGPWDRQGHTKALMLYARQRMEAQRRYRDHAAELHGLLDEACEIFDALLASVCRKGATGLPHLYLDPAMLDDVEALLVRARGCVLAPVVGEAS